MRCSQMTTIAIVLGAVCSHVLIAQPSEPSAAKLPGRPSALALSAAFRQMEDSLLRAAAREFGATPVPQPAEWPEALRAAEQIVGRPWRGLPASVLLVPDDGRGFFCGMQRCKGLYLGSRIAMPDGDSTTFVISSIVLVAQSAIGKHEIWLHELTHALLTQHGLLRESTHHAPRYFRDRRTIIDSRP